MRRDSHKRHFDLGRGIPRLGTATVSGGPHLGPTSARTSRVDMSSLTGLFNWAFRERVWRSSSHPLSIVGSTLGISTDSTDSPVGSVSATLVGHGATPKVWLQSFLRVKHKALMTSPHERYPGSTRPQN